MLWFGFSLHRIVQFVTKPFATPQDLLDGACVLKMVQGNLGNESFRLGIHNYLQSHAYGNAKTEDLWNALQKQSNSSGPSVASIMDTWTKQMGYPVVTVKRTSTTIASVSQERFFFLKPNGTIAPSPYNYNWLIPFKFITSQSTHPTSQLISTRQSDVIQWSMEQGWIKANVQQMGFYRVNYDQDNWQNLTAYLKGKDWTLLSAVDRAGLLDDAFALSRAGLLDVAIAFNLSTYLLNETDYVPWKTALYIMNTFQNALSNTSISNLYQKYANKLLVEILRHVGLDQNQTLDHLQTLLRSYALVSAVEFGNPEVLNSARALFLGWKVNGTSLDPNIKGAVYSAGIALGTEDDWNFMWNYYTNLTEPYEMRLVRQALSFSPDSSILSRYLNYSITAVRSQDALSVIEYVAMRPHQSHLAWNFVKQNWERLATSFGFGLPRMVQVVTKPFATPQDLLDVQTFFTQIHLLYGLLIKLLRSLQEIFIG
eukprot:Em0023g634a